MPVGLRAEAAGQTEANFEAGRKEMESLKADQMGKEGS